ncbi:extracellular solute-binding protein [Bacillaceae bacterium IKA-2]|nr:extracellular solute-binding protein [Bacillaceae bacterium IKA-2]
MIVKRQGFYKKKVCSQKFKILTGLIAIGFVLSGCGLLGGEKSPLDPDSPVSVTLWHYYSGQTKEKFDELVSEFNDTTGMEKGIVIDAQSQGDVQQLQAAVFDAANKKIGAQPLPDIFAAYPDNAYRINQLAKLVEIESYFSEDELQAFRQDFLDEGRFGDENKLRIIPVAKSSENLFLNKTFWDDFASETGANLNDLSTWEAIVQTAESYFNWSGGKAFLGIGSNSNYMLLSAVQLGEEMYNYGGDTVKLNFSKEVAKKIWDNYYIPSIKGYFAKTGRFSSDDAKTGTIIAYTGSTAGASYFPKEVTLSQSEVFPIESLTLSYPNFEDGSPTAVQQGAGMSITKSEAAYEYAAAEFLKWFTNVEQNIRFAVSTAYFPVKKEALKEELILSIIKEGDTVSSDTVISSIITTLAMLDNYDLYGYKPFEGSVEMRKILEHHLSGKIEKDLERLSDQTISAEDKASKIVRLISDESFVDWYEDFMKEAKAYIE